MRAIQAVDIGLQEPVEHDQRVDIDNGNIWVEGMPRADLTAGLFWSLPKIGPGWKEQAMPGITVGIDGSDGAHRALEWAMKEAVARHAPLTVVAVHEVAASGWTGNPVILPPDEPAVEKARHAAEELVAKAAAQLGGSQPVSVTVRAVNGFPVQELIEASRDADLLVVGSRGGGGFARLMMGSVSDQVVRHAYCPVVAVPGQR